MQVYKNALEVRKQSFGGDNLQVALAHEDLAYATYVNEYSSGICLCRNEDQTAIILFAMQESSRTLADMQRSPCQ